MALAVIDGGRIRGGILGVGCLKTGTREEVGGGTGGREGAGGGTGALEGAGGEAEALGRGGEGEE